MCVCESRGEWGGCNILREDRGEQELAHELVSDKPASKTVDVSPKRQSSEGESGNS